MEASGPALAAVGHSMAAVAWWAGAYCFPGAGFALGGHGRGQPHAVPTGQTARLGHRAATGDSLQLPGHGVEQLVSRFEKIQMVAASRLQN